MHEEEEGDARVPLASHGENGAFVEQARCEKRAEHEANIAPDLAPGYAPKYEERLPEKLVPALRPKFMKRLRCPWVVHHRRPGAGRVAEDGDGEERDQIVHHAESCNERDAREEVYRGRDEVARGQGQAREEDAPARRVADARHALDGRFDDVQDEKGGEEREESRAEEGLAFPWPCVGRHVHALAKVPSETAEGEHEVERILEPRRKHRRKKLTITIAACRRRRILLRRIWLAGGDGCPRDGFTLFVATFLGEREIDALAHDDEGEGGGAPVVDVVSWVEPDVTVGRVEGCGDECREQQ